MVGCRQPHARTDIQANHLSISADWNLIARIIQSVIYQEELFPGQGNNFGLGVYGDGPSGGPEWGLRLNITLLFPK
jgi:hypothetical protein